jgi:outer membrane protein OmpA-like peptidoglycan-associated protein
MSMPTMKSSCCWLSFAASAAAWLGLCCGLALAQEGALPSWFPLAPVFKLNPDQVVVEDYGSEQFDVDDARGGTRQLNLKGHHWSSPLYPSGDAWDGEDAWRRLRPQLERQGFKLVHLKQDPGRSVEATLQRGSGDQATLVEVVLLKDDAFANSVKIIEPAASTRRITLARPAEQPETVGDNADFPYLVPLAGARRVTTQHSPGPMDVGSGDAPRFVGTSTVTKMYDGPQGLSDGEFVDTYAGALQAAGWQVVQRSGAGQGGSLTAHFTSPTRDVWARLYRESVQRWDIEVADVGAGLRSDLGAGCKAVLYGVNFDVDKATLRPDAEPPLRQALLALKSGGPAQVEIGGHTDNTGTADHNRTLSQARADAVRAWLIGHGIPPGRLSARGYGDSQPVKPNTDERGRALNRRVELRDPACMKP